MVTSDRNGTVINRFSNPTYEGVPKTIMCHKRYAIVFMHLIPTDSSYSITLCELRKWTHGQLQNVAEDGCLKFNGDSLARRVGS